MALIRWSGFAGEARALHPKLLGDGVGTTSLNQKPGRGDLRPWRIPLAVATVPVGRKTIYRMGRDVNNESNYWLSWTTKVHAMRGFEAENTTERTYFTGDGVPKVTDNVLALASTPYPTASRLLGVPAPTSTLTASANSGTWTGSGAEYFYAYTYVNDWGWEEGQRSQDRTPQKMPSRNSYSAEVLPIRHPSRIESRGVLQCPPCSS